MGEGEGEEGNVEPSAKGGAKGMPSVPFVFFPRDKLGQELSPEPSSLNLWEARVLIIPPSFGGLAAPELTKDHSSRPSWATPHSDAPCTYAIGSYWRLEDRPSSRRV